MPAEVAVRGPERLRPAGVVDDDLALAEDLVLAVGPDEDGRRFLDADPDEGRVLEDDGDQAVVAPPGDEVLVDDGVLDEAEALGCARRRRPG
ncbi:MAG: hypothetical protein MZV64_52835 [Ignavibacteriales bacterium]|nr:hypothetical protein [Ignavibacteriales bacterium]